MEIQLSDHFTYGRMIRFTLPSIAMMIFSSVYGAVDGFFVSNYVGGTPFAALNLVMPFIMIMAAEISGQEGRFTGKRQKKSIKEQVSDSDMI